MKTVKTLVLAAAVVAVFGQPCQARWSWSSWTSRGTTSGWGSTTTAPSTSTSGGTSTSCGSYSGGSGGSTPAVPEPGTIVLMGTAMAAAGYRRYRSSRANPQSVSSHNE